MRVLPDKIGDFTGRADEAAAVTALLTRPGGPLVAGISGMAGVGKTVLALHVAHGLAGRYPDGRLFAALGGGRSPLPATEVLARFLRDLGVPGRSVPVDVSDQAALFRARLAGRRVLVVLDDAATAEQVRPLLPGSAGSDVLVTSRRTLGDLDGSGWVRLDVLTPDEAVRLLGRVADDDRVLRDPEAAAEVARLCGGLPLAVRVAGARLSQRPSWSLDRLAALLDDERGRLDRLAVGDLEVRASVALSLDGLDEPARQLFRGLGLFDVPDFPASLAHAVSGPGAPLDALVDAQLVSVSGPDPAGQLRYRFHDLVRLYAREQDSDPAWRAAGLDRGFGMWLALAGRMAERVPGPCYAPLHGRHPRPTLPVPAAEPLAWFDAERATLLAAVAQACELGLDEVAFDLAGCLEKYFDMRGLYGDWVGANSRVRRLCRDAGNVLGEAVMLRGLLDVRNWVDEVAGGVPGADPDALLALFALAGEPRGMSDAEVMRSWQFTGTGRPDDAVRAGTLALSLAVSNGHVGGEARAHVALAVAARDRGEPAAALDHLRSALDAARRLGNPRYEATVLQFLGIVATETGDLNGASEWLAASLAITRRFGDDFTEALTLLGLARVLAARGDAGAADSAAAALALAREHEMPHHVADALTLLGELSLAAGRPAEAVTRLEEAVAVWRTRDWLSYLAAALVLLGRARSAAGSPDAGAAFREARTLYERLDLPDRAAEVAALLVQSGDGVR